MSGLEDNHYARLGVSKNATPEEIRAAYHEAARKLHPDVNPSRDAEQQFLRVQEAYEVLSDPQKRTAYDFTLPPIDISPGIVVSTQYSRRSLLSSSEPQLFYVLQELKPDREVEASSPPINLCLVIDRSTSMQGPRMDTVKKTALQLVSQLRREDHLSIVTFSDRGEVVLPATRGVDPNTVEARLRLIQTGGGTEIFQGLKLGLDEITRNLKPTHINHLILITDGRTYGDEEQSLALAGEAQTAGITISGLGIGNEWNDAFLDDLTGRTGGSSMYVSSLGDIKRFLETRFKGISQSYAENVVLSYQPTDEVLLRYAFRISPDPTPLSVENNPLPLGNISIKENLTVLYEFMVSGVPEDADVFSIFEGTLKFELPNRLIPTVRTHVSLTRPVTQIPSAQPSPQRIVKALSRLTLYRMQEEAHHDLEENDIEQATRRLKNLATHLLSQGESKLASMVLMEAERIKNGNPFTEEGQKQIKYGTRTLILSTVSEGR